MFSRVFFVLIILSVGGLCQEKLDLEKPLEYQTRIFGGKPARNGQLPYQVGLRLQDFPFLPISHWCGGTLISNNFVLTAGHCIVVQGANRLKHSATVYLGANNRYNSIEKGQMRIEVPQQNFILYSGYNDDTLANDIALVKLPTPVQFNEYIQKAELPSLSQSKYDIVGKTVTTSGWGHLGDFGMASMFLMYMNTKVVDGATCAKFYGPNQFNDERQICINSSGRSTCQGDSGGPYILTENGVRTVIGITSSGTRNCTQGSPQILTRVGAYLNWISQQTGISIKY